MSSGSVLSPKEARIALLAARGLRNGEIAGLLSVSTKTVEWNLTKVYRKLGLRSRTELAIRLAENLGAHPEIRGFP